jgi:2-oxoglutarate ferredoxin oxidoreductase subunit delta
MSAVKKPKKGFKLIEINKNYCKGCDICIEFCPTDVFEKSGKLNPKGYYMPDVVRIEDCTGCRLCDLLCPEFAIVIIDYQKPDSGSKL